MSSLPSHPFKVRYEPPGDVLAGFFLPAFERAVRFDRLTGFASTAVLTDAACGLSRLIARGGRMRLLCGVRLTPGQVAALRRGTKLETALRRALLRDLGEPADKTVLADKTVRLRLEALAWMLSHHHLTIRLVLPRGADGFPLPEAEAAPLLAPEEGLLRDADGHKLAFSPASSETFWTFTSWPREGGEASPPSTGHLRAVERRFEELWDARRDGWDVLELPQEVRRRLLAWKPKTAPRRDPLEKPPSRRRAQEKASTGEIPEGILLRFLAAVPTLPGSEDLGVATAPVEPWPHQLRAVRKLVEGYPKSFLLADEVGLGKTVEAGLALRQLVLSGRVRRALLLVPKSVLLQWQEELWEKAALDVPRWEDGRLLDVFGRPVDPWRGHRGRRAKEPWNAVSLVLVSSQLARRRERRAALLEADPWDLVIVDEAHHARRQSFPAPGGDPEPVRPNRMLELLAGHGGRRGLVDRAGAVYLLSATPMQVHPLEVWDLLRLLGLGGRWGAFGEDFLRFWSELERPLEERDWGFLTAMLRDHLRVSGRGFDPAVERTLRERLGEDGWTKLAQLPDPAELDPDGLRALDVLVRRHTPVAEQVVRNTRALVRKYHMQGLVSSSVPERRPENVWIEMSDAERDLYRRIETYLGDYYRRYEAERPGLGFVMTVYRRRLTSSFAAITRSLEKRLAHLRQGGEAGPGVLGLAAEDLEEAELERDLPEVDTAGEASEAAFLEGFLEDLASLPGDTKLERLVADLEEVLAERRTVLVVTQYTDTLDALRDALAARWGEAVACYSGRGGEALRDGAWRPVAKETLKEAFRRGEVRLLLGTDALSEGLNLQTCGVLFNFDMPWNPMRVEQRIGRIDRIGQTHPEVWIKNYFHKGTVEAEVFKRLGERIRWFEQVFGRLQPILHRVGEAIEEVAMTPGRRRERRLAEELAAISRQLDEGVPDLLDAAGDAEELAALPAEVTPPPVTLAELGAALRGAPSLASRLVPAPGQPGVFRLDGERLVTFDPEVFDRRPSSVELLTWGSPLLAELLAAGEKPAESAEPRGLGVYRSESPAPLGLFVRPERRGARAVSNLADLHAAVAEPSPWTGSAESEAAALHAEARKRLLRRDRGVQGELRRGAERLLVESGARLLRRAAATALAAVRQPTLFAESEPLSFGTGAAQALARRGTPWPELLEITRDEDLAVHPDDPFYRQLEGRSEDDLERRAQALAAAGRDVVARWQALAERRDEEPRMAVERVWLPLAGEEAPEELPFAVLSGDDLRPFENAVPVYDLAEVAERFAEGEDVQAGEAENPGDTTWAALPGRVVPAPGLFVARQVGGAMDRRLAGGAWGVFRLLPASVKSGQVVLVRHPAVTDPDLGGDATLRVYDHEDAVTDDGFSRRVVLRPASTDPRYAPLVLDADEGTCRVLAVLVEVLG